LKEKSQNVEWRQWRRRCCGQNGYGSPGGTFWYGTKRYVTADNGSSSRGFFCDLYLTFKLILFLECVLGVCLPCYYQTPKSGCWEQDG